MAPAGGGNDFFVDNFRVVLAEIAPSLQVNNITVNEGSDYAVFSITTVEGLGLNLQLKDDSATASSDLTVADHENRIEYYDPADKAWKTFVQGQLTPTDGDAKELEGSFLQVSVKLENNPEQEGAEKFILEASYTDAEFRVCAASRARC